MSARAVPAPLRDAGFTLVETLVAMFIFALLAAGGSAVLGQTLAAKDALARETAMLDDLAALRGALSADLGQAGARTGRDALGRGFGFSGGGGGAQLLTLVRRGWANPGGAEARSTLLVASYELRDGALVRRALLRPDAAPDTPQREQVLMRGVRSADVRFLAGGAWSDVWAQGARGAGLPDAVELTLETDRLGALRILTLTGGWDGTGPA